MGRKFTSFTFTCILLCIRGQIPKYKPLGGLYSEERFNGGFFALQFWGVGGHVFGGAYTWSNPPS